MILKRKLLSVLVAIGMVSTLLMGCSKTEQQKTNTTTEVVQDTEKDATADNTTVETPVEDDTSAKDAQEPVSILIAAAASMENSMKEIIARFEEQNPNITVEGTYDSSGKLQTQIEEGMEADIFLSAATKQMNTLKEENLVDSDSIVELLENKVVLVVPTGSNTNVTSFEDVQNAETIALGDPESVPAGQYAKEIFESLGIYEDVARKASFGTNVTEILNWVAEGSADAGVVYATDAASTDKVSVIAEAPEGTLAQKVIYPLGLVSASENKEAAELFIEFLQSEEATSILEGYGFTTR